MKKVVILLASLTIVVVVGVVVYRMSTEAMAVLIGVVFGVAASIPTSLLVALAARRADSRGPRSEVSSSQPRVSNVAPVQPQVFLLPPTPQTPQLTGGTSFGFDEFSAQRRQFYVIGDEGFEGE